MGDQALWAAGFLVITAAATAICILLWGRRLAREAAEARNTVATREEALRQRHEAERRVLAALAVSERRHRALTEAGAIAAWRADPEGRLLDIAGWQPMTGQDEAQLLGDSESWLGAAHPQDRAGAIAAWRAACHTGQTFDHEFRIPAAAGGWRWCRTRAVPLRDGEAEPVIEWVGVVEDADPRRRAEEQRLLLAREVNHRAKNVLAVIQGLLRVSRTGDAETFAATVDARVAALARAHALLADADWSGADLRTVARHELTPYLGDPGARIEGEPLRLAASAVQPIAMVLHELATNAVRHGSLSAGGRVLLRWRIEGDALLLVWTERDGPVLAAPPERRGFGSQLIDASVGTTLCGWIEREWLPSGLVCTIALPAFAALADALPTDEQEADDVAAAPAATA